MTNNPYNNQIAIETILYIVSNNCQNMYNVLKVIYFANKQHLSNHGKYIYEDSYIAMENGPVPSMAYDIIKYIRGNSFLYLEDLEIYKESIAVKGNIIRPLRKPDYKYLGKLDRQSLDDAINKYGNMPFKKLKKFSHNDAAFTSADKNDSISFEAIIESLPNTAELKEHLFE